MMTNVKTGRPHKSGHQGELSLCKWQLPKSARPAKGTGEIVVGHSETGHHHVFRKDSGVTYYETSNPLIGYLVMATDGAALEHLRTWDTHGTWLFAAGTYEVRKRREYVDEDEERAVAD